MIRRTKYLFAIVFAGLSDNSATLGIRTCCGWSFGHSRDPVVVPRCARWNPLGGQQWQ